MLLNTPGPILLKTDTFVEHDLHCPSHVH